MVENLVRDLLYMMFSSRMGGGVLGLLFIALISLAFARIIPWWLFGVILFLMVAGTFAWQYLSRWWGERKDADLEAGLNEQSAEQLAKQRVRDRQAVKELQSQWKESVDTLKKGKIGKRKRPLYFLPWYVIIGAPASGKSTAIRNSGLHFPIGEPKLSGTGGTRNCDWWFAEEAIILDTAGRYTFHGENEPDREEWLSFLKLLKKYRKQQPLNGLLVTVAADSLITKDPDELLEDARQIRHKLDQLVREFGIQFPVYLIIAKCDLIEGFTDFFGRLPKKRLDEMLGWTNPSFDMEDPRAVVSGALADIHQRMIDMRTAFLWEEERAAPLSKIFLFPEELRAFERNLEDFCDILFRETQYNESPFLRGIYLTSGLQTGTSISRMLDRLGMQAQATKLPEQKKSYFLKDLFQSRLISDKSLVARTGKSRGRTQLFYNVVFGILAVTCLTLVGFSFGAYLSNRTLLNDVEDSVRYARDAEGQPAPERIEALSQYVTDLEGLHEHNTTRPFMDGWGLYMGEEAYEPARQLFLRTFETTEYVPALEAAREASRSEDLQLGFAGLVTIVRDYVLSRELNGNLKKPTGPNDGLVRFWSDGKPITEPVFEAFNRDYFAYLRWRSPEAATEFDQADLELIKAELPRLYTVPNVLRWANAACSATQVEELGIPSEIASVGEIPGAFGRPCMEERIVPLVSVIDLIAEDVDPKLTPQFWNGYFAAYFDAWRTFLLGVEPAPEGVLELDTLLTEESPYLKSIRLAADAARMTAESVERPAWVKYLYTLEGALPGYVEVLEAMGKEVQTGSRRPKDAVTNTQEIFEREEILVDSDSFPDRFGETLHWLDNADVPMDEPGDLEVQDHVRTLLQVPVYEAFGEHLNDAAKEIDLKWQKQVVRRFQQARTPTDVSALYGKNGGVLWKFFDDYLSPYYEEAPDVRLKERYTKTPPFRSNFGNFLNRVQQQDNVLTDANGRPRTHRISFEARPTRDPRGGSERAVRTVLMVECGDQPWSLEHRQNPASRRLSWSMDQCGRAELRVWVASIANPNNERLLQPLVFEGPTALIKLLQQARRKGGVFEWRLDGGFTAAFRVGLPDARLLRAGGKGSPPPASLIE